jgi:hypothetical protein
VINLSLTHNSIIYILSPRKTIPAFDWKVDERAIKYGADTFTVSLFRENDFYFSDCLRGLEILDCISESSCTHYFSENTTEIYQELFAMARDSRTRIRTYPHLKQTDDFDNYFNISKVQKKNRYVVDHGQEQ